MSVFKNINTQAKATGGWYPQTQDALITNQESDIRLDTAGNLVTRSAVLTDEGSDFQVFSGAALPVDWLSSIGTGGSVTVANSKANILSGTNAGAKTAIYKKIDYPPMDLSYTLSISQRISNQDIYFESGDHSTDGALDTMFARFHLYGTDNTKVSCEVQSSSDSGGSEGINTQILLPVGMNTSQNLHYMIELTGEKADFYVGISHDTLYKVATYSTQIPNPYTVMYQRVRFMNGTTPATSTTISVDTIASHNMNILDITGEISGEVSVNQKIIPSTVNSSTTNLTASPTAGYIFVGLGEPALNNAVIQVSLKTDQNCIVYVSQSSDGTNWDVSDQFSYNHNLPFGIDVKSVALYFRIRVENLSTSSATTFFRLQTMLCPISEPLPRVLSNLGNLKTSVNELNDENGMKGRFTPMKDLKVTESYRLVGTTFGSSVDTNFWTVANSGTGSAAGVGNSIATLTSGTTNGGYGQIQSVRTGRFIFAHPHLYRAGIRIQNLSIAGNTRRWGAFSTTGTTNPNDGFYFELSPANVLSCVSSNGGTPSSTTSGNFNGIVNEYIMNTNVHFYEIVHFLGVVQFFIDDVLLHTIRPTTSMLSGTFTLPITSTTINVGTSSGTMEVWAAIILRMGRSDSAPQVKFQSGTVTAAVAKSSAGVLKRIVCSTLTPAGTLLLYDAVTATNQVGLITWINNAAPNTIEYDMPFYTGLCYSVTGGGSFTFIFE